MYRLNAMWLASFAAVVVVLSIPTAFAGVVFYDNFAIFQANSVTTLRATFEGHGEGNTIPDPYTENGVTFFDPSNLYIATPGGLAALLAFDAPVTSNVLTVSGDEHITMTFSGPAPTAVGFASLTNQFEPPIVTVFDTSNVVIGTFVLTQAPSTVGFVGITSTIPIGSVNWYGVLGGVKDTAIDNVYVGAIPEPGSVLLLGAGLALLGFAATARRRNR